eukprot:COSAG02_NODE_2260_length_9317_cov_10.918365_11_plen_65_part_00
MRGAPEHFRLGVDERGRVTRPWAWAMGTNGWRAYPPGTDIMIRTVRIHVQVSERILATLPRVPC